MAIEKFLAMEDGEPGYTKTGTVTHVPFPAGGNGVQMVSTSARPWQASNFVSVPFAAGGSVRVEFTSTGYWAVCSFGDNGIGQLAVEFTADGIKTSRRVTSDGNQTDVAVDTLSIEAASHRWGIFITQGNTAGTGLVETWCDGVLVSSRAMQTTAGSAGTGAVGGSLTINMLRLTGSAGLGAADFDSVVISDAFEGDCHVDYLVPDGNGDTSQWVGSDGNSVDNWELVKDIPASDSEYVEADSEDLRDMYTVENLPASGMILAVQGIVHPWKLGSGAEIPTSMVLKTSAGEHVDEVLGMSTEMQGIEMPIHLQRPGGGAWTAGDVNGLQIGVTTEEA